MKKTIIALALGVASFACSAQADLFVGKFGHEYTSPEGTPVWEIKRNNGQYQFDILNDEDPSQSAHEFSENERRKFWKTMLWPEEGSIPASCVGNAERVMCYVTPQVRSRTDWLKDNKSNYFYYDQLLGVMEVQKLE